MGSPSRNVQYHPPRLSEDRLNPPPAAQSIFAYTLLREIGNAPVREVSELVLLKSNTRETLFRKL